MRGYAYIYMIVGAGQSIYKHTGRDDCCKSRLSSRPIVVANVTMGASPFLLD